MMNNEKINYIFDVLPKPGQKEMSERIRTAQMDLQEVRMNYTNPEIMFVATLRYYIEYFQKAANMLIAERFTVGYTPQDENATRPSLMDFPILPTNYEKP